MTEIEVQTLQWFAVRLARPQNPNRRTTKIGVQAESYRNQRGQMCKRAVKGSGVRVFVPEVILQRSGFEVFLPTKQVWRQKNRFSPAKQLVKYPLLVDWMFVGWPDTQDRWHQLMDLSVVAGIGGTGGRPIRIGSDVMDILFRKWGGQNSMAPSRQRFMQTYQEYKIGDRVRVSAGPLDGYEVTVVDLKGPTAKALLRAMGEEITVDIRTDMLVRM